MTIDEEDTGRIPPVTVRLSLDHGLWKQLAALALGQTERSEVFDFSKEYDGSLSLDTAVHQAIGAASVCWASLREAGEFNEARAREIADRLLVFIRTNSSLFGQSRGPLGTAKELDRLEEFLRSVCTEDDRPLTTVDWAIETIKTYRAARGIRAAYSGEPLAPGQAAGFLADRDRNMAVMAEEHAEGEARLRDYMERNFPDLFHPNAPLAVSARDVLKALRREARQSVRRIKRLEEGVRQMNLELNSSEESFRWVADTFSGHLTRIKRWMQEQGMEVNLPAVPTSASEMLSQLFAFVDEFLVREETPDDLADIKQDPDERLLAALDRVEVLIGHIESAGNHVTKRWATCDGAWKQTWGSCERHVDWVRRQTYRPASDQLGLPAIEYHEHIGHQHLMYFDSGTQEDIGVVQH